MRNLILLFLFSSLIFSCSSKDEWQDVKVENRYSISLPSFLTTTDGLNDEASLQYMNGTREFYTIVIDESKAEFHEVIAANELDEAYTADLPGYAKLLIDNFTAASEVKSKSKTTEFEINGMPAIGIQIAAAFDGIDLFCAITYIEGKETYYQVFAWTLKKYEKEYKEDLLAIAPSLKEI